MWRRGLKAGLFVGCGRKASVLCSKTCTELSIGLPDSIIANLANSVVYELLFG